MDKDTLFGFKLCQIASKIIVRNQTGTSTAYANTQEIDEQLDNLGKEMPQSWWEIPNLNSVDQQKNARSFDRLISQIWYFQLEGLLHLPFMLKAATERRYEYSKVSCLIASREMLHRYITLRIANTESFCCKIVDFGALTATVTLLLGLIDAPLPNESEHKTQHPTTDKSLIQGVLAIMDELSLNDDDLVSKQCANVIRTLMNIDSMSACNGGNLRLAIPYFGLINILRMPATSSPDGTVNGPTLVQRQETPSEHQEWQDHPIASNNAAAAHIVSFISSQFQPLVPELPTQNWREADNLFFDSLLGNDIDPSWVYE
jgi:hypothetical protein